MFLFLLAFQPFGLCGLQGPKLLILGGYGLVTFCGMSLFLFGLKDLFSEQYWTVWKEITFTSILVVFIGVCNYIYSFIVLDFPGLAVQDLLKFLSYTFLVGIIPITVLAIANQSRLDKKHTESAAQVNSILAKGQETIKEKHALTLKGEYKDDVSLDPSSILYFESQGNYVEIAYHESDQLLKKQLRISLSKLYDQIQSDSNFFKCHRAFITCLDKIENVSGNAQGLRLKIKDCDKEIPVSRNLVKAFRAKFE